MSLWIVQFMCDIFFPSQFQYWKMSAIKQCHELLEKNEPTKERARAINEGETASSVYVLDIYVDVRIKKAIYL